MKSKRLQFCLLAVSAFSLFGCDTNNQVTKEKFAISISPALLDYGNVILDSSRVEAGETVDFEIFSTNYNQYLKSWTIKSTSTGNVLYSNVTNFKMPEENVIIEAVFERYNTRVKTIAHRGLNQTIDPITEAVSETLIPNSFDSFKKAATSHVYGMETDVHKTKDGIWVCNHDKDFLSGGKKVVISEKTYNELADYPVDNSLNLTATLCSLKDYLELGKKYNKLCLVEVKEPLDDFGSSNVHDLVDFVFTTTELSKVKFISFYTDVLEEIISYNNKAKCQYLISVDKVNTLSAEVRYGISKGFDLSFHQNVLDAANVSKAHMGSVEVNAWTINSLSIAEMAIAKGIDYITTDAIVYKQ